MLKLNHPSVVETHGAAPAKPGVLMMGTGEYTTGYVGGKGADSDKSQGVVGLVCLDLMQKGKINRLGMCGTNGTKLPGIMKHMDKCIGQVWCGGVVWCGVGSAYSSLGAECGWWWAGFFRGWR